MQNVLQFLQAQIAVEHRRPPQDGVMKLSDSEPFPAAPKAARSPPDRPAGTQDDPGPDHPFPVRAAG
ncbi:hypothetical protein [Mangrovicoccus ximenensis]|uniref:hypothetical protein n=1 Tax=Mangrovicoccus ximenensis TaxID=1911570 RepID=UPI000D340A78|nr:hypothetical protein [Mangrovicoccus ximenensis]